MKKVFFIAFLFFIILAEKGIKASVIVVDSSKSTGLNNGTSWANAFLSFQAALDASVSGDTIWVAKGTYKPSYDYGLGGGSRYFHFRMKNGVAIYGGFDGTETAVSQRTDFRAGGANETILSGDLNGDDVVTGAGSTLSFSNNGENCYHVFYHPNGSGLNNTAMLDGFSITGGNANGTSPHNWGGGISNFTASVSLNNVSIYNNFSAHVGGGISNFNSSPVITNFSMRYNSSLYAAMYSNEGSPVMINGLISDNKGESGGALCCNAAPHALTNVTITNNYASWRGGAMYCYWSDMNMNNCIVWGNTAADVGNQVYTFQSAAISFNYSCYANETNDIVHEGGYSTNSNSIITDPQFANTAYKDYRISGASPCADAGNDAYTTALYDVRGTGFERKLDKSTGGSGTIDMGGYEYKTGSDPLIPCINPVIGGIIAADQSICQDSVPAMITNINMPTGYSGTLEFQWQFSTTGSGIGFTNIAGTNDSVYQPPLLNDTTWYKRLARVNCMIDWNGAAESNAIQIAVNPVYSFTEDREICAGDSTKWQGKTYTAAGTYSAAYNTVNGCDSTFTLHLSVNPSYHYTENREICGGDTCTWQGNSYTNAGTYTALYVTDKGCDSLYTLNLTVHPLPLNIMNPNGLQAYYPFNGDAADESGHGNDGVIYGPVLTTDKESNPNSAYSFNGVNDFILIGDPVPASLQIQNEITLSAWIYATHYPSNNLGLIVGSQCDACSAAGASIFLDGRANSDGQPCPPGHIHFQIGNGNWHASNNNSQVPLNQWVHVVATRKANENARIYLNGVLQPVTSAAWDGSVSYSGAFFAIGRQRDTENRFFNGSIDEVRVFNRSLGESEVQALYHAPSVHVVSDTLCENDSAEILLFSSQKGISYQLKKNGLDAGIPQNGNEAMLAFTTGSLSSTSQFTIEATDTATACSVVMDTILTVTVNKLPAVVTASSSPESLCVSGQVVFSATASSGTISWYDAATDGNKISVLNPVIDTTTTYYAEAISPQGCVSLNRTAVTASVFPVYFFAETQAICNGDTYAWHGNAYAVAGTYITAYTTVHGCDSIFKLNLSVNSAYDFAENHEICEGDSYIWRGNTYRNAGKYTADFFTNRGCDSTYTLNLTVNPAYTLIENHGICDGDSYTWQGNTYTDAGAYQASFTSAKGCDSTITLNLSVNIVDTTVVQDGITLTSNVTGATYQWLNCANNFAALEGETNQDFSATVSGIFAVKITQNNCIDTSACFSITTVGIDGLHTHDVEIYPNPVSDELIIERTGDDEMLTYEIVNAFGQVIGQGNFNGKTRIQTSLFAPGTYFIKIGNGKIIAIKKFIKE